VRSGLGTYVWYNGDMFVGEWEDDKRNVRGTLFTKWNGHHVVGVWKDDVLVIGGKKDKKMKKEPRSVTKFSVVAAAS
jgi:hypothetical protein